MNFYPFINNIKMQKRILVISNTIDAGGAETFVMKVFRAMDRKKYVFDFLINKRDSDYYLKEIEELGGKVFYGVSKSKNPIKCFTTIKKIVRENNYKTILCIAVHPAGFIDLLAAKMGGAKIILTRSTNSHAGGLISPIIASLSRPFMRLFSTVKLSPSKEAAVWLFGKRTVKQGKVKLINNGVDISVFLYNEDIRKNLRKELGISEDCLAVGHIGRFNRQKNHFKIIGIFKEIITLKPESRLILVGEGDGRKDVEKLVEQYHLSESVLFLGIRKDVPALLSAFDVMVFPSLFEGMPNTIIEAQACDLPCVISDTISPDVKINADVIQMPLEVSDKEWATSVINIIKKQRGDTSNIINKAGYSIGGTTKILTDLF